MPLMPILAASSLVLVELGLTSGEAMSALSFAMSRPSFSTAFERYASLTGP